MRKDFKIFPVKWNYLYKRGIHLVVVVVDVAVVGNLQPNTEFADLKNILYSANLLHFV